MSVLVFVESSEGQIKKSSLEALCYGYQIAIGRGTTLTAVSLSDESIDLSIAGLYGAAKVLHSNDALFDGSNAMAIAAGIQQAAQSEAAKFVILAKSSLADAVAPRLAARLQAGLATNATALPIIDGDRISVMRSIFTGKAFAMTEVNATTCVITVRKNAVELAENPQSLELVTFAVSVSDSDKVIKHISEEKATGEVLLPEAEIVVSAGRGMKGPENWGLIENLAATLHAATACSKPVSDLHWRPHHEHVGQTGIKVAPNLYIAVGISGAIQHLAGISASKCIVAINSDPEAPIFKAADYGIVGDAFQILPKLNEAFKAAL
jgi:electron transfer flavoprotein alpha subunit